MSKASESGHIRLTNLHPKKTLSLVKIKSLTAEILKALNVSRELHITFVNDVQIRPINKVFHGTNTPTDVLAFPAPKGKQFSKSRAYLGEIIISIDRAIFYAKRFRVKSSEELVRYIIHGALHLLGERDDSPRRKEKMFRRQEKLIAKLAPVPQLIK